MLHLKKKKKECCSRNRAIAPGRSERAGGAKATAATAPGRRESADRAGTTGSLRRGAVKSFTDCAGAQSREKKNNKIIK